MKFFILQGMLFFLLTPALASEFPAPPSLVQQMSLDEEISLLAGTGFATAAIPRLNVPAMQMSDGALGIRFGQGTQWPSGTAMAASFDPDMMRALASALGEEARGNNVQMLLGPNVNIARTPWGGRLFENYGEDPYLTSQMVVPFVQGVQSQGVAVSVKHLIANDQEWNRASSNVIVDERSLREIYLPPFKAAVDAGALTVMAAYPQLNGQFCSENKHLLTDVLKTEWGFQGLVVSDWGATHSTVPAALAGLDLEMPNAVYFGDALKQAFQQGQVSKLVIDDKANRILGVLQAIGLTQPAQPDPSMFSTSHPEVALKMAQESLVLLKNRNHALPLLPGSQNMRVAILGTSFSKIRQGGGSSLVHQGHPVSALQGLQNEIQNQNLKIKLLIGHDIPIAGDEFPHANIFSLPDDPNAPGFQGEYYPNTNLSGTPALVRPDNIIDFNWEWGGVGENNMPSGDFSVRWTANLTPRISGDHILNVVFNDGARVYLNNQLILDKWVTDPNQPPLQREQLTLHLQAGQTYSFRFEYLKTDGLSYVQLGMQEPQPQDFDDVELAKSADAAVIFVGDSEQIESESYDRGSLKLTPEQEDLILKVAAVQSRTIVVIQAGAPVEMSSWLSKVQGVLLAWFPGEQGGPAMAQALLGEINPSGHLPVSFPVQWADSSAAAFYPGQNGTLTYGDGIFVGYRHFDQTGIRPLFPFGFGLSYTQFQSQILDMKIKNSTTLSPQIEIQVQVHNRGDRDGASLVSLYVRDLQTKIPKAPKQLKAFQRVSLKAGETKLVTLPLGADAFQYFNPQFQKWQVDAGHYQVQLFSDEAKLVEVRNLELH